MTANHLILNGYMATGKSTVGRLAAGRLGLQFVDIDDEIERRTGRTVSRTFLEQGETSFRQLERHTIRDILSGTRKVVALGGGALLDESSRQLAEKTGSIMTLTCSATEIDRRIGADTSRPLLNVTGTDDRGRQGLISAMLAQRAGIYDIYPSFATEDKAPDAVASSIENLYRCRCLGESGASYVLRFPKGPRTVVSFQQGQSVPPFSIGPREERPWIDSSAAIITDDVVGDLHIGLLDLKRLNATDRPTVITIPPGENAKNLDTVRVIYERLRNAEVERDSVVVALGGGVVCDIAGFVAATYLRGLDLVLVPTTLLAQVDAAIGGKTGVDLDSSKNLIGAFHPARQVFVNPDLLDTLPVSALSEGLAEMIKIAFIRDQGFSKLIDELETVEEVRERPDLIRRAIRNKIEVVMADPYEETGGRALLNFGHTIGHGLESLSGLGTPHGQCVSMGLVAEARLSHRLGHTDAETVDRLQGSLQRFGLPTELPDVNPEELLVAMRKDKKRVGGKIRMVMINRVGSAELQVVEEEDIVKFLDHELTAISRCNSDSLACS